MTSLRLAAFTMLLVFAVNPSIPRESIDFLAGYEVPRCSSLLRREIFKLPLPPRSLFVNAARFALIRTGLASFHALIDISFST